MILEICVFSVLTALLFLKWHLEYHYDQFRRLGIGGPKPSLLFGNLKELRDKGQFRCMQAWTKQHGKVFGFFEGYTPVLTVSEPSLLREIMLKDSPNFLTRKHFPLAPKKTRGLFLENGAQWKRSRNLLTPAFSTGKLKMMTPIMSEAADILVERLTDKAKEEDSTDIYSMLQPMTLDVIGRCAFGLQTHAQVDTADMFLVKIRGLFKTVTKTKIEPLLMILPCLTDIVFGLKEMVSMFRPSPIEWLRQAMYQVIWARRALGPNMNVIDLVQLMLFPDKSRTAWTNSHKQLHNEHLEKTEIIPDSDHGLEYTPKDSLKSAGLCAKANLETPETSVIEASTSGVQQLADIEIVAHSITFLLAGYETSGAVLAYFCHELAKHPELQDRLLEEIKDAIGKRDINYETIQDLPLFDAVYDEVLRLYPTSSFITTRKASEERQYGDVKVTAGMNVLANVWALHRDPDFWDDPETFNPDRWLGDQNAKRKSSFTYLPFGAGPRHCIAMRFATIEAKITMVKIVQNFQISKARDTKDDLDLISRGAIVPENEVNVKLIKRVTGIRRRTTRHC
ncbi:cytochrome p450 3a9 [Plakobranchus ocellatus]|uniref:Cytochrome p450 3a9 n=1 Tax=Plakobranchus ocellatus TaxID=259542 RepID=A0AAV4AWA9_9GAST|nr:cytochrome p450 3a9 [Plakobranchus ocellatus]